MNKSAFLLSHLFCPILGHFYAKIHFLPNCATKKYLAHCCGGNIGGYSTDEASVIELTERQRVIYNIIKKDGHVTAKSLAGTLAVSARTIEHELSFLKNKGFVRKEGKSNKGVWIILK